MRRLIYLTVLIFIGTSCHKNDQNKTMRELLFAADADPIFVSYKNFEAIPLTKRQNELNEQFNNNSNNWVVNPNGAGTNSVANLTNNGFYLLKGDLFNTNNPLDVSINRVIDGNRNFEIEFSFIWTDYSQGRTSFLYFGNENQRINLGVNFSFIYSLIFKNNDKEQFKKESQNFSNNNQEFALITLRKIGNYYLFYVNHVYEGYVETSPINISKIGFVTLQEFKIDYLKIDYLNL